MSRDVVDFRFGQFQTLSGVLTSLFIVCVGLFLVVGLGALGFIFVGFGVASLLLGMRFRVRVRRDVLEVRNLRVRTYPLNDGRVAFLFPDDEFDWPAPRKGLWVATEESRPVLAWATWRGRAFPRRSSGLARLQLLLKERSPQSSFLALNQAELKKRR